MPSEVEIVKSALKGDSNAFRRLVETYQKPVYLLVLSSVRDEFHAQDLTQDTFVRAYLNLEQLKDMTKFGAWVCGIARNVSKRWLDRHHFDESLEDSLENGSLVLEAYIEPDETLSENQSYQQLWQGVYSLPENLREVLLLFYMRGMNRKEIADFLDTSESAIRNRLHKARKSLREVMEMLEKMDKDKKLPDDFTDKVIEQAMKEGKILLRQKRWKEAKQSFLKAVDIKQDYAPAYAGIGLSARGELIEQLDNSEQIADKRLLEEAIEELSRAYRLGDRDEDTVWALGNLYRQFQYYEEASELFWRYYQDEDNPQTSFKAGMEALWTMVSRRDPDNPHRVKIDDTEIVKYHHQLIDRFKDILTPRELIESYRALADVYDRTELTEDWLSESECFALPNYDKLWLQPLTIYTIYRSSKYAWKLKQTEYGIKIAEDFIEYARNRPDPHPYRRTAILDVYGQPLLASYAMLKWDDRMQSAIADIDQIVDGYEDEWHEMQNKLENMSDDELKHWDDIFDDFESGYGNKREERYPVGGNKAEIRQWLDMVYQNAIDAGLHQIGCVMGWKGDGERAIRYFLRKRRQDDAVHNMFMAEWMLLFHSDRKSALEYVRRAANRNAIASGYLKFRFNQGGGFTAVKDDPEFLALINATL